MDKSSDQLFARAALADDEHRQILSRHPANALVNLAHSEAVANEHFRLRDTVFGLKFHRREHQSPRL